MRAAVCLEPGKLVLDQRDAPLPPPPGWVTLEIARVGICGTDYHIFEGKHPFLAYPRVMGHELSGRVAALGDGVSLPLGSLQIVNPYLACGVCAACDKGKPNCCMAIEVLGVHRDGGMCDQILVPAGNLYSAGTLSPRDAGMVEFLAIGAHAVRRAVECSGGIAPADRALVVGVGPIGLGTAIFARIAGLNVTLLDASEERLQFAHDRIGFASTLTVSDATDAQIARLTEKNGFDVIFDCTGFAGSIEAGFTRLAHGGTYVLVSVVKDRISFADPEFHKRETTLVGSRNATAVDFQHVIASIAKGLVPLDALATHVLPLEALPDFMAERAHDKRGLIKAIIEVAA
jgi:2-desacetyl-2-hydroxyethyl bacteriochlorophyllide A dehydrogenase